MPAIVEHNSSSARTVESADPLRLHPIHFLCGRKTMDEHDRLTFPLVEIGDLDVAVPETWHGLYLAVGGQGGNLLRRSAPAPVPPPAKNSQRRMFAVSAAASIYSRWS